MKKGIKMESEVTGKEAREKWYTAFGQYPALPIQTSSASYDDPSVG